MTMVSSGPISLGGTATTSGLNQSVNVELGRAGTASINMNESAVRTLAAVPSGAISMSNFYGKSNRVALSFTFSSSTADASLNLSSIGGYRAGTSDITVTINSGVYLYATSTGGYGLNLTGGTSGDTLTVVNNGFIMGMGGRGSGSNGGASNGGAAVNLGFGLTSCTFNNTNGSAYIGGGGGGGGRSAAFGSDVFGAGGGAGGAQGGNSTTVQKGTTYTANGGAGGGIGSSGSSGGGLSGVNGGGGGGRIFPGSGGGEGSGGGAGGGGGYSLSYGGGGSGGSSNNAGSGGGTFGAGGGGGWGASGGSGNNTGGAGGGKAVNLNGKSITWTSGNTTRVWGSVS